MNRGVLLKRAARALLWVFVAVIMLRGINASFATPTVAAPVQVVKTGPGWPDDQARVFAAGFTRAYLTADPFDDEAQRAALEQYANPGTVGNLLVHVDYPQIVESTDIARTRVIDRDHAQITVAARVAVTTPKTRRKPARTTVTTRYLIVPVTRDTAGRLAVTDPPGLDTPPARATFNPDDGTAAAPQDVQRVLAVFLQNYLGGNTTGLAFLTPPDVHVRALDTPYDVTGQINARTLSKSSRGVVVFADADVKDRQTGATFRVRYRVRLVLRDRWYVQAINPAGSP